MSFPSASFVSSRRMGIYDPNLTAPIMGGGSIKPDSSQTTGASSLVDPDARLDNRLEAASPTAAGTSQTYDQEENRPREKVLRRLAQNREAAKKSRLKKKAYVQELERSRMRLSQLEQELQKARRQGLLLGVGGDSGDPSYGLSRSRNAEIATFEMQYGHWLEEERRQIGELRSALQQQAPDVELSRLVESGMGLYDDLFRMKTVAAKSDVFYVISGMWRTPTERFFLWIGGFRPSEVLKVLCPLIDPLTDHQVVAVCTLQQSCAQAEDALSQGMERLQQTLADTLASERPRGSSGMPNCVGQMATAMGKLDALVSFVNQADHLRQQTLHQMHRILTTRQAARALLVLGDYLQRLRVLSSIWSARPREPT